jgi:hypothetical protein
MQLKTIDIKGKDYVEVAERIRAFRELHPLWAIETRIIDNTDGVVVMEAVIKDEQGRVLATGHAYEQEGSNFINTTSFIENCETSAVGRALAILGIGIDSSVASAEEVANAIENQEVEGGDAGGKSIDDVLGRTEKLQHLKELAKKLSKADRARFRKAYPKGATNLSDSELDELEVQLNQALEAAATVETAAA